MKLKFLSLTCSVCQLEPDSKLPDWADDYFCVTRTPEELTIIIESSRVPESVKAQHDFGCFCVSENLDFSEIGVIAGISRVLAQHKISILSISTYNTDYFLVPNQHRLRTIEVLENAGYNFIDE